MEEKLEQLEQRRRELEGPKDSVMRDTRLILPCSVGGEEEQK